MNMVTITINLPSMYLDVIKTIVDAGEFSSRSDMVRVIISRFLQEELAMAGYMLDSFKPCVKNRDNTPRKPTVVDMRTIRWETR